MVSPSDVTEIITTILFGAQEALMHLRNGNEVVKEGESFGSLKDDTEIFADQFLAKFIEDELRKWAEELEIGRLTIEGFLDINLEYGSYWYCVDPLDGSLNYKTKGNTVGLPYTSVITVLDKVKDAKFSNIISAAVLDLRCTDFWTSFKDGGKYYTFVNGLEARTMKIESVDLASSIIVGEMYYPDNRDLLLDIFKSEKGWLRNPGSAAYEMALVSSGSVSAFICNNQKQHELGAAYALVKGAGGELIGFDGKDISLTDYKFNAQTPVIIAANNAIATEIYKRVLRNLSKIPQKKE